MLVRMFLGVSMIDIEDPRFDPRDLFVRFRNQELREFRYPHANPVSMALAVVGFKNFDVPDLVDWLARSFPLVVAQNSCWTATAVEWLDLWLELGFVVRALHNMNGWHIYRVATQEEEGE